MNDISHIPVLNYKKLLMKRASVLLFYFTFFICLHINASGNTVFDFLKVRSAVPHDTTFSGNTEYYSAELKSFMGNNLNDENNNVIELFIEAWNGEDSLFSNDEKTVIMQLSRKLIDHNAKPSPHFINFLACTYAFKQDITRENDYITWNKALDHYLSLDDISIHRINHIILSTLNLLKNNAIYISASTVWKCSHAGYKLTFDQELTAEFEQTKLSCYAKRDSIEIKDTKGRVYLMDNKWEGKGGIVTWERGGYNPDDVYATIDNYSIDLHRSEYTADSVVFINKVYFEAPLKGTLNDKVKYNKDKGSATYPQFSSYTKSFSIAGLYNNIDYEGGLSMQGAKLIGTGTAQVPAQIYIYHNDTLRVIASSGYFGFKANEINGRNTSILIKLKKDSIFHPGLTLHYTVANKELILMRGQDYTSKSPYFNSYHNMDMSFEQLTWRMDEPFMRFTASRGSSIGNANFQSVSFFDYNNYLDLQGRDAVHPLISIRSFARKFGWEEFPVRDYAEYLKMPEHVVKQMLMRMSVEGFVFYDNTRERVTIKPRLHDYIAASVNRIDYDVINFPSRVEVPLENAIFDLQNFDLTINGIPRISVSNSQNVLIYPRQERIILKKNRSFQFDGIVDAGLFSFYGSNLFFSYDSFKIDLQNVDSLHIRFQSGKQDNYGFPVIEECKNMIRHITGEILIDEPDNKSGRKSYPEYPVFKSKENSYVYYNTPDIQNGIYDSDDFFFEVKPFTMDSLNNFNAHEMNFNGEFQSAGIFPPIEQTLGLQADNSLGFQHSTNEEGLPVYGGKGTYKNNISLDNKGLWGSGRLEYLTSVTRSDNFIFYPDSMDTRAAEYTVNRKTTEVEFPYVHSDKPFIHWMPYIDEMYAYKKDDNFTLFNDSTLLAGNLKLTPGGLSGEGRMDLTNSDLISDHFEYKANEIYSDTADFRLKSIHTEGFTVLTDNINARIDYNLKKGVFQSNEGFTLVNFPENRYLSYIDQFVWDMQKEELAMGSDIGSEPESYEIDFDDMEQTGPTYISMHPGQDSLSFRSSLAYYDYEKNLLKATRVKYLEIADARIYPDSMNVTVEEDAEMTPLHNATIQANRQSKYHVLHSATIKVTGKNDYHGSGNYDYVDENNDVQLIRFEKISVDTGLSTIASGKIVEPDDFTLSPNYSYQGKVNLDARDRFLTFEGAVHIESNCNRMNTKWVEFKSVIDPDEIFIPLPDEPVGINKTRLFNGLFVYYDSVHIYPAFLTPWKNYSDNSIISSSGYLYYDKASQRYKIASKQKIFDQSIPGNYVSLHRESCNLYGEGKLNLGQELGQVSLHPVGNARYNSEDNSVTLDLMLAVDFYAPEEIINIIAYEIDSLPNLSPTDLNSQVYVKGMNEWLGVEKASALKDEVSLFGSYKEIPPELEHTILFNELTLVWNDETNSYRSVGEIGIGSINKTQINKKVKGMIELQIKRSGDILDIYLEADPRNWYYFGYTRGVMQTLASNREYLDMIKELKPRQRKRKAQHRGGTPYNFIISTDRKMGLFLRRYREALEEQEGENK